MPMPEWLERGLMTAFTKRDIACIVELNKTWDEILEQRQIAMQQGNRFGRGE